MAIMRKLFDYLVNATPLGGFHRYRIVQEIGDYLGLSPKDVYNIGREFLVNGGSVDAYDDRMILCRYAYVNTTPLKRMDPVYEFVARGKVLDYGSGIGTSMDAIRRSSAYSKCFLDLPGPALQFCRSKYQDGIFYEAPCADFGRAYDLIFLTDVLEHVVNPMETLEQVLDALSVGGVLVYHFSENTTKAGHLHESILKKPECEEKLSLICDSLGFVYSQPRLTIWRKMRSSVGVSAI